MNRSKKPHTKTPRVRPRVTRDLIVRAATPADAPVLVSLVKGMKDRAALTVPTLKRDLFGKKVGGKKAVVSALVGELDGTVVAVVFYTLCYDEVAAAQGLQLSEMRLSAVGRERSVGPVLLAACAARAKKLGATYLRWVSEAWDVDAHDFYRRMGTAEEPVMRHGVDGPKFSKLADEGKAHLKAR